MTKIPPIILAALALTITGCKSETNESYRDTTDGLAAMIEDIAKASDDDAQALVGRLKPTDPSALYARFFDGELPEKLAEEIKPDLEHFPGLANAIKRSVSGGRVIQVEKFTDPQSNLVTLYQQRALGAMKTPVPLYSVRITERDNEDEGVHVRNFVYLDGRFLYVGKMKAARGRIADKDVDQLAERRIGRAKQFLREKSK